MDVLYLPFGKAACGDLQCRPFSPASNAVMLGGKRMRHLYTQRTQLRNLHMLGRRGQACRALTQNWGKVKLRGFKNGAVC